jgi:hypothetical protein
VRDRAQRPNDKSRPVPSERQEVSEIMTVKHALNTPWGVGVVVGEGGVRWFDRTRPSHDAQRLGIAFTTSTTLSNNTQNKSRQKFLSPLKK